MQPGTLVAARMLATHRLARTALDALPLLLRPADLEAAYDIQACLHEELASTLGPVVGHKIGCTTPVMQAFLGIAHPCAGAVFASTVHASPARLRYGDFVRVGVECEIVVLLGADLPARSAPYDATDVAMAVEAVMPGMEIVDARYVDYTRLDTPTLVADDFFDAGCVLGAPTADWRLLDLASVTGVTRINGVEVGRGRGADVLGHPLEALAWLANQRSRRGVGLRAGEFVFTGSVVATQWLAPGDHVAMSIEGLGDIAADFPA